jgi:predicted AAA+ superfamily ATPase
MALFPQSEPIATQLEANLRRMNPYWQAEPLPQLPPVKRWAYAEVIKRLKQGPAKGTVLRGPRQIGKSTLVRHVIQSMLDEGIKPTQICYIQFDDLPELRRSKLSEPINVLVGWFEKHILGKSFNQSQRDGEPVYLFLDEVQNLDSWAEQLKFLVDMSDVRVLVTGSSALRIELGRDSLAGRISTLEMGPLYLREILSIRENERLDPYLPVNGLAPLKNKSFWDELRFFGETHRESRLRAFRYYSERGAYPVAQSNPGIEWSQLADLLNETVIQRAIEHDLRMGPRGSRRDEQLLRVVFRLACRYAGQSPNQALYVDEIKSTFNGNIGWQRILQYLKFLDGTLLLRLIDPLELRLRRKRGPAKICICDHALRASWLQEVIPLDPDGLSSAPHMRDLAGHLAESAVGYFFKSITGLDVAHFPERGAEPEVDYVLTVGEQRIPIEVKYRTRIDYPDTRGLRSFIEKSNYNAPFGILVTLNDSPGSDDPRIVSLPLSSLLLMR